MSGSYIASSLSSLSESTSLFASIRFDRQCPLSEAVLSNEREFEQAYIRDAEPHELALFESPAETLPNDEDTAMKRVGPQAVVTSKEKASPLKDRQAGDDPQRCLVAAQKLLDVYPVPKASEHVNALLQQLRGLIDSLQASEEALKQPIAKTSEADETAARTAELQEAIKREQMEIFAIEQMNEEKKKAAATKTMRPTTTNGKAPTGKKSMKDAIAEKRAAAKAAAASNVGTAVQSKAQQSASSPVRAPIRSPNRAAPSASPLKAAPVSSTPAVKVTSPVKSPEKTPTKLSPRQPQQRTPVKAATPVSAKTTPKKAREGVPDEELANITAKLWSTVGDALRPWARKSIKLSGQQAPSPLESLPFEQTKSAIQTALQAKATEPASPGSLASTAVTNEEEDDPAPPVAQQLVEFELLRLLLDTMSGVSPSSTPISSASATKSSPSATACPPLTLTYRDALSSATKEPMVSMTALKAWLLKFAKERECSEDLATKAIYALVSKNVLRIDRRGTAAVGFRA